MAATETAGPTIGLPPDFHIVSQDARLKDQPVSLARKAVQAPPPLGVLSNFTGTFAGTGFNTIFRPNSGQTTFTNPIPPPAIPNPPNENVLELNLTTEQLTFSNPLGSVPNRGLEQQPDITLNGVPYVQAINDVTDIRTGKGTATPSAIHFEPGLWMHVPATTVDPNLPESLTRMASIPHGTTINAQSLEPTTSFSGPPPFTGPNALPRVDITPFPIGSSAPFRFASQTASNPNTPRLPQDLTTFIKAGTITQDILDNPNLVLANAIKGQNITKTIMFTVSTKPTKPFQAGGTANIDFLQGSSVGVQTGPNAGAVEMDATFYIETVEQKVQVPGSSPGKGPVQIQVHPGADGRPGPALKVQPPENITEQKTATVTFTQIQYMQTVFLNFAGLTWPHVSCATLIPSKAIDVPASAWK